MSASSHGVEREPEFATGRARNGIANRIGAVVACVRRWGETFAQGWRTRHSLSALDDRLLRDIGSSREQVGPASGEFRGIADIVARMIDPGDRS